MPDLIEQGVAWWNAARVQHLARPVVYQRGSRQIELAATPGATQMSILDDAGATLRTPAMDFIVSAAELALDGQPITPEPGDRIRLTVAGKVQVYEVLSLGDEHYRSAGPPGVAWRIHAKQVAEEDD